MKFEKIFKNKKIIITGHTGFKGSWLTLWMTMLGANVLGISKNNPTRPSHLKLLKLDNKIKEKKIDIRNIKLLKKTFKKFNPDFVFHLAAQALVHNSYEDPLNTWSTNTIGTINVLESLRELKKKCVAVLITSDKSYKNIEIERGYKEGDLLGGKDPYSASKASAEMAIQSYIESFFKNNNNKVLIAVARAGNVIGGGDWSENRLIPDCIKSWSRNKKVILRSPNSTRPWQHVLEAISGYLYLAVNLSKNHKLHGEVFNFGPTNLNNYNVLSVVKLMKTFWKNVDWQINKKKIFFESKLLKLNSNKAKKLLKWNNKLSFKDTIKLVALWYRDYYNKKKSRITKLSSDQILNYEKKL